MKHYDYQRTIRGIYDKAATLYAGGQRGAETFFSASEVSFLEGIGSRAQDFYDYAEDLTKYGEPDFETALAIQLIRRDYFLNVQNSKPSNALLDETQMPGKDEKVLDIEWLPRLIPKTKAKLRGELPTSLMYGCGGDRKFFKAHDIHPAEFLAMVWRHEKEDAAIIDWVVKRNKGSL